MYKSDGAEVKKRYIHTLTHTAGAHEHSPFTILPVCTIFCNWKTYFKIFPLPLPFSKTVNSMAAFSDSAVVHHRPHFCSSTLLPPHQTPRPAHSRIYCHPFHWTNIWNAVNFPRHMYCRMYIVGHIYVGWGNRLFTDLPGQAFLILLRYLFNYLSWSEAGQDVSFTDTWRF